MAELSKAVLGRVSGTLGDITFRQRNGKSVVATRPRRYPPPDDQGSIDRRARFKVSSKLAVAVSAIPDLFSFWSPKTPPGMSTHNYIIQRNVLVVKPSSVSGLTAITPEHSYPIALTGAKLSGNGIAAALGPIGSGSGIDVAREPNAKLACVLSLTNPSNETYPDFLFVPGISDSKPVDLESALTFEVELSAQAAATIESYADRKILVALLNFDAAGTPMGYSETAVSDLTEA